MIVNSINQYIAMFGRNDIPEAIPCIEYDLLGVIF